MYKLLFCLFIHVFTPIYVFSVEKEIFSHDRYFGKVQSGEIKYVSSEFINNSSKTIHILKTWTSCPCFKVLSFPDVCEAYSTIQLPIRIDTAKRVGETTQTLYIVSDVGEHQSKIYGEVLKDIQSAPSTLIVNDQSEYPQHLLLYVWSSTERFSISRMQYNSRLFDIYAQLESPNHPVNKQHNIICSYEITVVLKEEMKVFPHKEIIEIHLNSESRPIVVVEVTSSNREHSVNNTQ